LFKKLLGIQQSTPVQFAGDLFIHRVEKRFQFIWAERAVCLTLLIELPLELRQRRQPIK
jgi:hypothetical protein